MESGVWANDGTENSEQPHYDCLDDCEAINLSVILHTVSTRSTNEIRFVIALVENRLWRALLLVLLLLLLLACHFYYHRCYNAHFRTFRHLLCALQYKTRPVAVTFACSHVAVSAVGQYKLRR